MSSNEVNTNFQRDQIAQVFKTPDMIRAFESLVRQATETTPAENSQTTEEIYSIALSGGQQNNSMQNQINEIKAFIGMT